MSACFQNYGKYQQVSLTNIAYWKTAQEDDKGIITE